MTLQRLDFVLQTYVHVHVCKGWVMKYKCIVTKACDSIEEVCCNCGRQTKHQYRGQCTNRELFICNIEIKFCLDFINI